MNEEEIKKTLTLTGETFLRKLRDLGASPEMAKSLWEIAFGAGRIAQAAREAARVDELIEKLRNPLIGLLLLSLASCSDAKSGGRPEAERVFTGQPGYVCFLVRDEDGRAVGGNCVKE